MVSTFDDRDREPPPLPASEPEPLHLPVLLPPAEPAQQRHDDEDPDPPRTVRRVVIDLC